MKNKRLIWGFCAVLVLIAISAICYFCFIKKDNEVINREGNQEDKSHDVENSNTQNNDNTAMQEITITNDSQKVLLGDSEITLKEENGITYINGQLNYLLSGSQFVYKINDLLFFLGAAQCNYAIYIVDKTGNIVNEPFLYQFSNLRLEENRIVADGEECPCLDEGACPDGKVKVEFVYDGTKVSLSTIEKSGSDEGKDKLEQIEISDKPTKVALEGNEVVVALQNYEEFVLNNKVYHLGNKVLVYKYKNLLYVLSQSQCLYSLTVFDKIGTIVGEEFPYQIHNLRLESGKLIADGQTCPCYDNTDCKSGKFEIVYDGSKVTLNKIN